MDALVPQQAMLILEMAAGGFFIGILYDFTRCIRWLIQANRWVTAALDLIFWLICAFFTFALIFANNFGQLRLYVLLGMLSGTIAYFWLFSALFTGLFARLRAMTLQRYKRLQKSKIYQKFFK